MRALLLTLLLLAPALPAGAGTASVYYFSHDYRITFDLAQAVEEIINSAGNVPYSGSSLPLAGAAIKPESASTAITYTTRKRGHPARSPLLV